MSKVSVAFKTGGFVDEIKFDEIKMVGNRGYKTDYFTSSWIHFKKGAWPSMIGRLTIQGHS